MNNNIIVEYKDEYVHARQYGPDSYDTSLELWKHIVATCEKHNCFNILGETFTTRQLSTMEGYNHIKIFKLAGVTKKFRIAWVHHSEDPAGVMRFIENILKNRGMLNGALFPTVKEATQ